MQGGWLSVKTWAFFCSNRSLAVCFTKKSLLHKFTLGQPQDILNFFVFRLIKMSGWVLLCQEGEGHRISCLGLELSALQAAGAECSSQKCAFGTPLTSGLCFKQEEIPRKRAFKFFFLRVER